MTDHNPIDLDHGPLGFPSYDPEQNEWLAHERGGDRGNSHSLTRSIDGEHARRDGNLRQAYLWEPQRSSAVRDVLNEYPLLQPAAPYLSRLLLDSADTSPRNEVLLGDRLVVAAILKQGKGSKSGTEELDRVVVTPGPGGSGLSFYRTEQVEVGFEDDGRTWHKKDKIVHEHPILWRDDDDQVLQICQPDQDEDDVHSSRIAVRLPHRIWLFQPLYPRYRGLGPSQIRPLRDDHNIIEPNPRLELKLPRAHKSTCAHIAFNPWDHTSLAVIHSDGAWAVWSISDSSATITTESSFSIAGVSDDPQPDGQMLEDGWHSICWCVDIYHVMACNRRNLQLFDISGVLLANRTVSGDSMSALITDVRRCKSNEDLVYVTTTYNIELFRARAETSGADLACLVSIRHHRDPFDVTLHICVHAGNADDIIWLHSRHQPLVSAYRLLMEEQSGRPLTLLALPGTVLFEGCIDAMLIEPLVQIPAPLLAPTMRKNLAGTLLYQSYALLQGSVLHEHMISTEDGLLQNSKHIGSRATVRRKLRKDKCLTPEHADDDFIIPDDAASSEDNADDPSSKHIASFGSMNEQDAAFTVPNDHAYNALRSQQDEKSEDLVILLKDIRSNPSHDGHPSTKSRTLLNQVLRSNYRVIDIDAASEAAAAVNKFTRSGESDSYDGFNIQSLGNPQALGLRRSNIAEGSLAAIYRRLVASWLRPLPSTVSTQGRLEKEKIVRSTAASIYLASNEVRVVDGNNVSEPLVAQDNITQAVPPAPGSRVHESQMTRPPLPVMQEVGEPLLGTIRLYTSFADPTDAPTEGASSVLDHWTLGDNPAEYDYNDRLAQTQEDTLSESEKQQRQRKAERKRRRDDSVHRKRLRIETADSLDAQLRPTMPNNHKATSSPARASSPGHNIQSQQTTITANDVFVMPSSQPQAAASQMQPGKYGGRLAFRGKRKAGF